MCQTFMRQTEKPVTTLQNKNRIRTQALECRIRGDPNPTQFIIVCPTRSGVSEEYRIGPAMSVCLCISICLSVRMIQLPLLEASGWHQWDPKVNIVVRQWDIG